MTIITAHAVKEYNDSKVGIAFSRSNIDTPLVIKLVRDDGLFADSALRAGMTIVSIMGQEMTLMLRVDSPVPAKRTEPSVVSSRCEVQQ